MLLMCLDVGAEFEADVLTIVKMFAGEEIARGESVRGPIAMWKGVEPKYGVGDKPY
jgi:hypothetical protein